MLITFTFLSRSLAERRRVTVYSSSQPGPLPQNNNDDVSPSLTVAGVNRAAPGILVWCADGQYVSALAQSLQEAPESHAGPPLILAGPHSGSQRQAEYEPGVDDAVYAAHLEFLLEELPVAVAAQLNFSLAGLKTAVWGVSYGGALAISLAALHPARFDAVIAFSAMCRPSSMERLIPVVAAQPVTPLPRYYLAAGTRKKGVCKLNREIHRRLSKLNCQTTFVTRPAAHENAFWLAEFPRALAELYGTDASK